MLSRLSAIVTLGLLSLFSTTASALTVEQFTTICASAPGKCSDHPVLQAYIGGALDLLATLDTDTSVV